MRQQDLATADLATNDKYLATTASPMATGMNRVKKKEYERRICERPLMVHCTRMKQTEIRFETEKGRPLMKLEVKK